ncbi:MAG: HpcH/HpaI aldolase/citrate lyase family protein [Chloroflexota bacterium]
MNDDYRCSGRGNWSADGWIYRGQVGAARDSAVQLVRRSRLFLPINVPKFVEKAWTRGADSIVLDLEDAVAPEQKNAARALVKDVIPVAGKGGADVLVRINKSFDMAVPDLDAAVWPGLTSIHFPKAEYAEEIQILDKLIAERETARGMPVGSVRIALAIETALGLQNALAIATASPRAEEICFAPEDYCLDMDIEPSRDGRELFLGKTQILVVARLAGINGFGLMASGTDFSDVDRIARLAREARQMGYKGSSCYHPAQVQALNDGFSFSPEEIGYARRVISVLEAAEAEGRDSVALDGKMIDIPIAERARRLLARAEAIARMEARKREAMESAGGLP